MIQQRYCMSSTGTVESFTSFQSLHRTLTSSICGPDLLPNLFNDGQQFCIFVLRHLAARGALRYQKNISLVQYMYKKTKTHCGKRVQSVNSVTIFTCEKPRDGGP